MSILDFLNSKDPLSAEAIDFLLKHKEEDSLVDYKENFHPDTDKEWLEITKDVMAFANTFGGYIVFGIRDKTYEVVGLESHVAEVLANTNQVLQKLNRHIAAPFTRVRTRVDLVSNNPVAFLHVPRSRNSTHIFVQDGKFAFPSGKGDSYVYRQGTLYVRQSAGNHLVDAHDLDALIGRRVDEFRSSIMDRISKVVSAPMDSKVLIRTPEEADSDTQRMVLSGDQDAIPVKGLSFTVSPETPEEKLAALIAISRTGMEVPAPEPFLWECYANRNSLRLPSEFKIELARFSVRAGIPSFFWLRDCSEADVKAMLIDVAAREHDIMALDYLIGISGYLDRSFFRSMGVKLTRFKGRLRPANLTYPGEGDCRIASTFIETERRLFDGPASEFHKHIADQLDSLVSGFVAGGNPGRGSGDACRARAFDCFLYARVDKYKSPLPGKIGPAEKMGPVELQPIKLNKASAA